MKRIVERKVTMASESKFYQKNLSWTPNFVQKNIDIIERNYEKFPSRNRWNCNCHVIHDNDLDAEPIDFEFLRSEYENQVILFCESRGLKFKGLGPIWYNYYKSGQYQEPHVHEGSYTFIHYMIFDNSQHSSTKFTDDSIESPKINQGDILIFDGELEHYVPANSCTSPRLTVAFTFDAEPMVPKGNEINTENIFPTSVWWVDLDLNNDALAEECYQIQSREPKGRVCSTRNGYQSNDLDFSVNQKNLLKLIQEITKVSNAIFQSEYLEEGDRRKLYVQNYWVNINPKGGSHIRHTHPGAFISGVYYVKCVSDLDHGSIRFWRSEWEDFILLQNNLPNKFDRDDCIYHPVQGRLLLFPSHLPHSVDRNELDSDRIAVSFNLKIRE